MLQNFLAFLPPPPLFPPGLFCTPCLTLTLPPHTQDEALRRAQRPLEMFFPFDPYLLKRSSRFLDLKTSYVRWRRGHPRLAASVAGARLQGGSDSEVRVSLAVISLFLVMMAVYGPNAAEH